MPLLEDLVKKAKAQLLASAQIAKTNLAPEAEKVKQGVIGAVASTAPVKVLAGVKPSVAYGQQEKKVAIRVQEEERYKKEIEGGKKPEQARKISQAVPTEIEQEELKNVAAGFTGNAPIGFNPATYVTGQVAKREAARKAGDTLKGKAGNLLKEVKTKFVDFNAPIEDTLSKSLKESKISLPPSQQITNQIDKVLKAPAIAKQFIEDKGLSQVIKTAPNLDYLDQYMIAKHAPQVEARGFKTGRNALEDKQFIDSVKDIYEPYAQKVSQYSRDLLDEATNSGLVSKKLGAELKKLYPDYVPINRIIDEVETHGGSKATASLSGQSVVQKLKGSEREIESPLASLVTKTRDVIVQSEKNKAARLLASYKDLPGNPFQLKEIDGPIGNRHTISYLDDGVKKTFETTKEIAAAAKALDVEQLNILIRILSVPTRIARAGITGVNIPFLGANIAKDQVSAFVNSKAALRSSIANPKVFVQALFDTAGQGEFYKQLVREGGTGSTFDLSRNAALESVQKIRAGRNIGSKIKYNVTHPTNLFRAVEDILSKGEQLTRNMQARGAYDQATKQGLPHSEAIIQAARAYRENTVNFSRRGEFGKVLNSTVLYFNAGIQGNRTFLRALTERPVQTSAKLAIAVFTPVAATTAWNLSDPTRKAAYEDIAEYEKQNNIIIIPFNPTKDEDGKWNVIKIPLSQEVNNIAGLVRQPIEQAFGSDPVKAQDIAQALVGSVTPFSSPTPRGVLSSLVPQGIKPTLESATNQNFFTGFPQIPESLKNASPEMQVKKTTSGTARQIGGVLNMSPIKVEEFIKGTIGGVGSQALHYSDLALFGLGIIPEDQVHGQAILEAVTARFSKARGGETSKETENQLKGLLMKQTDENLRLKLEAEGIWTEWKNLPQEEKIDKVRELSNANPQLFEKLKKVISDEKKGLSYADRLVGELQVKNGERAKFIVQNVKDLKSKEEKIAYLQDLKNKGLLSDSVFKQVKYLLSQKN